MWLGLILTLFFGSIILLAMFCLGYADAVNFNKTMTRDEYRYNVLNQPYDRFGFFGSGYYNTPLSNNEEEKFLKYQEKTQKKNNRITRFLIILPFIIFIILIVSFSWFGAFVEQESLNKGIERYIASKEIIEESLDNDNLTGVEKFEIVKQAKEENKWLAEKQYEVKQWYRFYLDKDVVLNLEFIALSNLGE